MNKIFSFILASIVSLIFPHRSLADTGSLPAIHEFKVKSIEGEQIDLSTYKGKVLLIVNTASQCGFTPQYEDLENLYNKYREQGFTVLGFPANNYGGQEPGSNKEIKEFCKVRFGVTFPLFEKNDVSGENIQPFFKFLTNTANPDLKGDINWNFEKFLINKDGKLVERFGSFTNPMSGKVIKKIESLLAESK
jgi:glutathione peroxidase